MSREIYLSQLSEKDIPTYDPFSYDESSELADKRRLILRDVMNKELTARQKECIVLYFGNGMKINQIAEKTGLTKGTISKHISKGKVTLKKYLEYSDKTDDIHFIQ